MIDEVAATALATELLGRANDDPEMPWQLLEFPEGWLIRENLPGRGGVAKVIERSSGAIKYFPGRIAPVRIMEEYESVADTAREVSATTTQE